MISITPSVTPAGTRLHVGDARARSHGASADVDVLEAALEKHPNDGEAVASARADVAGFAGRYRWSTVLQALVDFCRVPRRAADLAYEMGEVTRRIAGRLRRIAGRS